MPVKSVNEQLHIEKDCLFQVLFEVLVNLLQRNPGSDRPPLVLRASIQTDEPGVRRAVRAPASCRYPRT